MIRPSSNISSSSCWHCSLLSYEVSYLKADAMHHFAGYLLPGLIFSLLGLRWAAQLVYEWTSSPTDDASRSGKGCKAGYFSLPWEGIIKLILTGSGIVVSVVAAGPAESGDDQYVGNIRYATIYLFFALSGLTDILVYYCGYAVLPEGVQSLILSLAFSVEGVLFAMRLRFEGYLEQQVHALLLVAVLACAWACAMEVLYDNRLVKFCRAYLCLVQGTWLLHGGFIMQGVGTGEAQTYPDSLEWVSILFTWHVAGDFVLFVLALLLSSYFCKTNRVRVTLTCCARVEDGGDHAPSSTSFHSSPATVQTNASPTSFQPASYQAYSVANGYAGSNGYSGTKGSGLTSFNYIKQLPVVPPPPGSSSDSLGEISPAPPPPLPSSSSSSAFRSRVQEHYLPQQQVTTPAIVEAVPRDNLVMSDEYRTLTRVEEDQLRGSIMLKESSLI